jgi:amidase
VARFTDYDRYDALGLAELVRKREVTPTELLEEAFARVDRLNPRLNAVVMEVRDKARAWAASDGLAGPFGGVPFLIKDLGCEAIELPSNSGSRFFANIRSSYDCEVYLRLKSAGLITFGRTTSPELGIGPATEAQVYGGPTRNPWGLDRTSGGSSGGAGSAVAAGIVPAAHGSDGGGSIRIPASNCGLFGLKPTRARLPDGPGSGEGWAGMASDGFLTRSVRDTAALLDATQGADLSAPYWAPPVSGPYLEALETPDRRIRIAVTRRNFLGEAVHADCVAAVDAAAKLCEGLGHEVVEAEPALDIAALMRAWTDIAACGVAFAIEERSRTLGRGPEPDEIEGVTRGAIEHAKTVSGARYLAAVNRVHDTGRVMARFLGGHDMLLSPTMAEPPAAIGRFKPVSENFVDYRLGKSGVFPYSPFTALFNATGQPAMSVPLHWSAEGLPVGVHFAGRFGDEARLLKLAAQLERAAPWFDQRPKL